MSTPHAHRATTRRACALALLLLLPGPHAFALRQRGRIAGVVRSHVKAPVAGAIVVAINQVTSRRRVARTDAQGRFQFSVPPGAYRVIVDAPDAPRFDRENIIVEPGRDASVEIELKAKPEGMKQVPLVDPTADERPVGAAGGETVESAPQRDPRSREVRDRWRVSFPEYDRYGSAAGGRDIPFKRGKWYDPYSQNLLKGDYPIFGNKFFMILSAVDSVGVEQRRTPIPSNINSARPGSAEFFGKPEVLGIGHTLQFSFEMFHGDTTFRPRNWAIKISPTLSLPNYVRTREVGVVNVDPRRGTNRTDWHLSFEDAFAEVKLEDLNANFDFGLHPRGHPAFRLRLSRLHLHRQQPRRAGLRRVRQQPLPVQPRLLLAVGEGYQQRAQPLRHAPPERLHLQHLPAGLHQEGPHRPDHLRLQRRPPRASSSTATASSSAPRSSATPARTPSRWATSGVNTDGHMGRINLTTSYYFANGRDDA